MPESPDDPEDRDEFRGDEPADAFDEIQTELMHAREGAERSISEPLNQVTVALDSMQDEAETDARPDRLEEIERELVELQSDAEGETNARIKEALEKLGALQRAVEDEESED